jgi:hypothetical protein
MNNSPNSLLIVDDELPVGVLQWPHFMGLNMMDLA